MSQQNRSNGVWWLVGGIALAIAIAIVVVVAVGGDDTEGDASGSGDGDSSGLQQTAAVTVSGDALPTMEELQDDAGHATAPTLTGEDFEGAAVAAPTEGEPTMFVFGAHWCPHCQKEFPEIVEWMEAGGNEGVRVVAVPTGTNPEGSNYPPSSWLGSIGWTGDVLLDDADGTAAQAFGLRSYPYIAFVGADGKVAMRTQGEVPTSTLDEGIAQIAAG